MQEESVKYEGVKDGVRIGYTRDGDGIGLYYIATSPDLSIGQTSVELFCAKYRAEIQADVVEVGI